MSWIQPKAISNFRSSRTVFMTSTLFLFSSDMWLIFLLVSLGFFSITVFWLLPTGVLSGWAECLPSQETFLQPAAVVSSDTRWSRGFQCCGMRPPGQLSPKVGPCSAIPSWFPQGLCHVFLLVCHVCPCSQHTLLHIQISHGFLDVSRCKWCFCFEREGI